MIAMGSEVPRGPKKRQSRGLFEAVFEVKVSDRQGFVAGAPERLDFASRRG